MEAPGKLARGAWLGEASEPPVEGTIDTEFASAMRERRPDCAFFCRFFIRCSPEEAEREAMLKLSFKAKVFALSVMGIVVTGVILFGAVCIQRQQLHQRVAAALNAQGREECAKIAQSVYLMLRTNHEKLQK